MACINPNLYPTVGGGAGGMGGSAGQAGQPGQAGRFGGKGGAGGGAGLVQYASEQGQYGKHVHGPGDDLNDKDPARINTGGEGGKGGDSLFGDT